MMPFVFEEMKAHDGVAVMIRVDRKLNSVDVGNVLTDLFKSHRMLRRSQEIGQSVWRLTSARHVAPGIPHGGEF